MPASSIHDLQPHLSGGGIIHPLEHGWRLQIPAGPAGKYRLAQLDDYQNLSRQQLPHRPPWEVNLECRASGRDLPGTWGFGLWNDPFSLALGLGGGTRRFPALPQTAWFFFASPSNYLSFRDDLPAQGQLAAVFRSQHLPTLLLALAAPLLPLLVVRPLGRLARRGLRRWIQEDAARLESDPRAWRQYRLVYRKDQVRFYLDQQLVLETSISPSAPLGFVLWIDNQYAALDPQGRLGYGTLANPESAWIEVRNLSLEAPSARGAGVL